MRRVTWVPVAKISRAMSGMALSLNSAVVKLPMSSAPGAKVPRTDPNTSGTSMVPPGILFSQW